MLEIYQEILFSVAPIYIARKKNIESNTNEEYLCLLIDKFCIHSATFYHITEGIIPSVHSKPEKFMMGFDIFSFNSTFRAILETYLTLNGVFFTPQTNDSEKKARFCLWKLEGLISKGRIIADDSKITKIIDADKIIIEALETEFENSLFYKQMGEIEISKIYKRGKRHCWKFSVMEDKIKKYDTLDFTLFACKSLKLRNMYKLASMHAHSGFYSIEQFKSIKGKVIDEDYINHFISQTIYLTCCLIKDLVKNDELCKLEFDKLNKETAEKINFFYSELRSKT